MTRSNGDNAESGLEWKGWGEFFDFWDEFVKGWYDCKTENGKDALPPDRLTKRIRRLFDAKSEKKRLSKDELPEPYCIEPGVVGIGKSFDPAKVGMVVIQMNPGAAQGDLEATKFYSNKDKDEGFLIRDFADEKTCGMKFSKWVERWSCFRESYPALGCVPPDETVGCGVPPSKVCGHDWWWEENPVRWFRSFAGCELSSIFALETIPYHSVVFNIASAVRKPDFREYLLQRVLLPAGICAQSSRSKLVVCCGDRLRKFLDALTKSLSVNVSVITNWEKKRFETQLRVDDERFSESLNTIWPKNDNGKYSERWYKLYRCEIPYVERSERKLCRFLFLSIYANGMCYPAEDFDKVEMLLKERIKEEEKNISEKVPLYVAKDALAGKKDGSIGWMSNPDRIGPVIIDRESLQRLIKDKKD